VTTVRDLGDRHVNVVERRDVRRQVDNGLPWILASGPPITTSGGHCGYLGGEVGGADEIVAAVRERVEGQVDVVKVMASGSLVTTGTDLFSPQFSIEEVRLLVEQAHAAGLPVTAHAHAAAAVDQAVAVDVDGIEHASYVIRSAEGGPAQAHATKRVGVVVGYRLPWRIPIDGERRQPCRVLGNFGSLRPRRRCPTPEMVASRTFYGRLQLLGSIATVLTAPPSGGLLT
jgi:imidazolonepropionase-like amidohydrolase